MFRRRTTRSPYSRPRLQPGRPPHYGMSDPRNPFGWTNPMSPNNPNGLTNMNSPNNPFGWTNMNSPNNPFGWRAPMSPNNPMNRMGRR